MINTNEADIVDIIHALELHGFGLYSVKNTLKFFGPQDEGFNTDLYHDGRKVCNVSYDGAGGQLCFLAADMDCSASYRDDVERFEAWVNGMNMTCEIDDVTVIVDTMVFMRNMIDSTGMLKEANAQTSFRTCVAHRPSGDRYGYIGINTQGMDNKEWNDTRNRDNKYVRLNGNLDAVMNRLIEQPGSGYICTAESVMDMTA